MERPTWDTFLPSVYIDLIYFPYQKQYFSQGNIRLVFNDSGLSSDNDFKQFSDFYLRFCYMETYVKPGEC